ncbi:MAG TPA: J domain-containing protein [Duganella sp.]
MAPQEVIRAAYKALSQKYHPDKNPGDEKAARIMAILNGAYDTLSDTQRRKEHDEWIAAEEWEIEWLESTRNEDGRGADKHRHDADRWSPEEVDEPPPSQARLGKWKWWGALAGCLAIGWVGGMMGAEPTLLATTWGGKASVARAAEARADVKADAKEKEPDERDEWAVHQPFYPEANSANGAKGAKAAKTAPVKVVAMSQIVLPGATPDCEIESQTLVAPNGEPWPAASGYLEGFTVGNRGDDMQLMLDNGNNASAVFIKIYDIDRRANVRYAYVLAHDKLMVDKLSNGKYEIRYQNLDLGANRTGCSGSGSSAGAAPPPSRSAAAYGASLAN